MSRRRRRPAERAGGEPAERAGSEPAARGREPTAGRRASVPGGREHPAGTPDRPPGRAEPRISFLAQVGILLAVFAIVSLVADLAGAANLGVALGIGQIAFAIALVVVIVKT
jgi:hypothetical protein